jgi:hypothetical protein
MSVEAKEFKSRRSNACAMLSEEEFAEVRKAAELLVSSRTLLMSLTSQAGDVVEKGYELLPTGAQDAIRDAVVNALTTVHGVATTGMDDDPGRDSWSWLYRAAATMLGGVSGALGFAAILAELPVTTGFIFRSIADIARSRGESLSDPEVQALCIEAFAYGGPLEDDDDADIGFFMARVGAVEASQLIAQVGIRYATVLMPKIVGQMVPITGAVVGASLNLAYISFYQSTANVLLTLLPVERRHDRAQVRSCFASVVEEVKQNARRGRAT